MKKAITLPPKKVLIIFILAIFIFSISLLLLPGKIYGATLNVGSEETYTTIESAITAADPGDTIMVAAGTYTENLTIDKSITLTGAGASSTIIDGSDNRCILISNATDNVNISGFTITGGSAGDGGGGIKNYGTLSITGCIINDNTAKGFSTGDGGGIFNRGTSLTITNSTISGNTADDEGGGIYNDNGTLTITNSTISGNTADDNGGGIYKDEDTLTITNSTISGNTTDYNGGGIYNNDGTLTITNSTISGNTADGEGGGIYNLLSSPTIDATYNWWGSASGPYNLNSNPSGTGDSVSDNVDFTPWLTNPVGYKAPSKPLSPQGWVLKDLNICQLLALYGETPEGFIKMLYDTILERVPDIEGQNHWTEQLNSGAFSASQVAEHLIFSDELGAKIEAMNNEEFISFLYSSFLSRTPDTEGFNSWIAYMNSGVSKLDAIKTFMNNEEWFNICTMFNVSP